LNVRESYDLGSHAANKGELAILAIAAMLYFENARLFVKNAWHFKDIFREFEAFLKLSILVEDISREIETFFN
jgi:hypothetical protein